MKNAVGYYLGKLTVCAVFAMTLVVGVMTHDRAIPSSAFPNEPSGLNLITDFPFTALPPANTGQLLNGWALIFSSFTSIITDGSAPLSPSNVMEMKRPVNSVGGGKFYYDLSSPVTEGFVGFWWKPSSPFDGWLNLHNKLISWQAGGALGAIWLEMIGERGGTQQLAWVLQFPGVENSHLGSGWGDPVGPWNLYGNRNAGNVTLGQWHKIEYYFRYGTSPTSNNGIIRWWMDGVLIGDFNTVNYPSTSWIQIVIDPAWDSNDSTQTNVDSHRWDHLHISRASGSSSDTTPPAVPTGLAVR